MCYANKFILYLYGNILLSDIHTKECVYTSLQDKCKGNIYDVLVKICDKSVISFQRKTAMHLLESN